MIFRNPQLAIYIIPALLIAITFHEYAHGWVADRLGDPTPGSRGRLSLNPIVHIDPFGLLMLAVVGFGWAKPVPVNPMYFRGDRRRGLLLVSLAGPVTNFLLAFATGLFFWLNRIYLFGSVLGGHLDMLLYFLLIYNVYLGLFNLLPVPPLDGSKILGSILPYRYTPYLVQLENYGYIILIVLLFTRTLPRILLPMADVLLKFINSFWVNILSLFL